MDFPSAALRHGAPPGASSELRLNNRYTYGCRNYVLALTYNAHCRSHPPRVSALLCLGRLIESVGATDSKRMPIGTLTRQDTLTRAKYRIDSQCRRFRVRMESENVKEFEGKGK